MYFVKCKTFPEQEIGLKLLEFSFCCLNWLVLPSGFRCGGGSTCKSHQVHGGPFSLHHTFQSGEMTTLFLDAHSPPNLSVWSYVFFKKLLLFILQFLKSSTLGTWGALLRHETLLKEAVIVEMAIKYLRASITNLVKVRMSFQCHY